MTLTSTDILVVIILFACVPLQYFLVKNWGNVNSSRSYFLSKSYGQILKFRDEYLNIRSWMKWLAQLFEIEFIFPEEPFSDLDEGESVALEVMQYRHKYGYFSFSYEPRSVRPPNVFFRIGQVVVHKQLKYKGVIIGWDEIAKAPPEWLELMHGAKNKRTREMPNYSIIIDTKDRLVPQLSYIPQEDLELIQNQIIHPMLDDHFEGFDGTQYIPRPWLRDMYPQD